MTKKSKKIFTNAITFIKEILGDELWDKQKEIVEAIQTHRMVAVKSAHGIGKTRTMADVLLWFLVSHQNSIVISTAPTWRQVCELLWREVKAGIERSKIDLPFTTYSKPLLELGANWYALGLSTKEPERFQGFHAPDVLIIVDEASGVPDKINEAIKGIMSSGNCRLVMIGNPTRPEGEFYEAFNSKRDMYKTITVSAFDTPNLVKHTEIIKNMTREEKIKYLREQKPDISYLTNASWVGDMIAEFGEDSEAYRTRVLGEFPSDDPQALIKLSWIEDAIQKWRELEDNQRFWLHKGYDQITMGVDVGGAKDESVIVLKRHGIVAPVEGYKGLDQKDFGGKVVCRAKEFNAENIVVDSVGVGEGVWSRCLEAQLNVTEFIGGGKASESDKFMNTRAENYWNLRKQFQNGEICLPPDDKLVGQLLSITWDNHPVSGKILIDKKKDLKMRDDAQATSPDRADALMYAFSGANENLKYLLVY